MELLEFDLESLNVNNTQDLEEAIELLEDFSDEDLKGLIEERQAWVKEETWEVETFRKELVVLTAVLAKRV